MVPNPIVVQTPPSADGSPRYLLLIDRAVSDISGITSSLTPNTDYWVFGFMTDKVSELKSLLSDAAASGVVYESIGVAQHNMKLSNYQITHDMLGGTLMGVSNSDPDLKTWSDMTNLLLFLKGLGTLKFDLLACDLLADENWQYVIEHLEAKTGVHIRASVNTTGDGGDFILESDGTNTVGIYFTADILNYSSRFYYTPTAVSAPHTSWNPPLKMSGSGGTISMSSTVRYISLVGSMFNCSAGGTYTNPPSTDITNVISTTCTGANATPGAYAVLTASGQVITFGLDNMGGNSSTVASSLTSGVTKVVASTAAFSALRSDGNIVSWGCVQYTLPITTTGNTNTISPSRVNLTGCIDVVSSGFTFAALKSSGSVVTWGYCGAWADASSVLTNVVQIKELYGYPSYAYIALRSDGNAVMWGPGGVATTVGLSTTPIVGIYPTDFLCVIVRSDGTIYKGFTGTPVYTIPAGRSIVRIVPMNSNSEFMVMFDDQSMFMSSTSTLLQGVSQVTVGDCAYGYIQNGAVVCGGDVRFGGSPTDATNGIKSGGNVSSGVIKLATAYSSMVALKRDGSVVAWGAGPGGYAYISGNVFVSGVDNYTKIQNSLTNVVNVIALHDGYLATTSDNSIISWGDAYNKWYGTLSTALSHVITLDPSKTTTIYPCVTSAFFVETSRVSLSKNYSPKSVVQYTSNTVTATTNIQSQIAIAGRKYVLYYDFLPVSSVFSPSGDTYTYTFTNIVFSTCDINACVITDITDVSYAIDTISIKSDYNPSIPRSNPPSIVATYAVNSGIKVYLTPPASVGGLPLLNYKYSLNNGVDFTTLPPQTLVSTATLGALTTAISTGGTATMMRSMINTAGTKLFVSDMGLSKLYTSTYNGTTWSALATVSASFALPSSTYSVDMNGDCTRGIAASINASSKCFYFTNSWASPVQIQDNVARTYTAIAMSSDGNTIAAIADKLYFTKWNDASQNYGTFVVTNPNTTYSATSLGIALNSDGTILAYVYGNSVYYAIWNGTNFGTGNLISTLANTPNSIRFSNDSNILFATGATSNIYSSVWTGSTYSPMTQFSASVTTNTLGAWGIGIDNSNNMYVSVYGSTSIFKLTINTTTTTTDTPNMFKITSDITVGQSYTPQFKAVNAGGDSDAVIASSAVVPYTLPSAPTILSVVPGTGQLTVNYSAGASNGSPITSYYYSMNNGNTYVSTGGTSGRYTITGLTSGTTYYVRLKSFNLAGLSIGYSIDSSGTLVSSVPPTPAIGTCTTGIGKIIVPFTQSSNGGSPITGYYYSTASTASYTYTNTTISPITITGLTGGTTYSVRLMAVNIVGNSAVAGPNTVAMPTTVPDQPVIGSITPGNTSASISFTAPVNGGLSITNYFYSTNNGTTFAPVGNTTIPINVSGLTNGTTYQFVIKAVNSLGNSAPSAAVSATPCVVPGLPTINSVVSGNQLLTVSFSAPASNGGSSITGYKYSINGTSYTAIGTSSPFTITGLTNGTAYTVSMKATNAAGDSVAYTPLDSVVPATVPNAPAVSSVVPGNQSITVSYTAPTITGGSAITNYWYSYDGTNYTSLSTSSAATPFTISGLTNGTGYKITMKATNIVGNSTVSGESASVVPLTTPNPPVISSYVLGDSQVNISYSLPYNGGNAIDYIQYKINGGTYTSIGTATTYTITGLTNGTAYPVQIRAHNAAGYSIDSSAVVLVPRKVPDPPSITTIYSLNGNIRVRFSAPAYNGGNAITGYAYTVNDGSYVACSYPQFDIPSLTPGVNYSVKVFAVNAAGTSTASDAKTTVIIVVPGAPTIYDASFSPNTAMLYFTDGSNTGPQIIGYKYRVTDLSTNETITNNAIQTTSPISVPDLSNGITYSFALIAYNCGGDSTPSTQNITGIPVGKPDSPTITSVVAKDSSALVTILEGKSNGDKPKEYLATIDGITYFTVYPDVPNNTTIPDAPNNTRSLRMFNFTERAISDTTSNTTTLLIPGLTNDNYYTIAVKAVNNSGESVAPSNFSQVIKTFTLPDAPNIISEPVIGNQSVTITIENQNLSGATIYGYEMSIDGNNWTQVELHHYKLTLTGLTNGNTYVVYVRSISNAGSSPYSVSKPFTPSDVPSPPTITRVVPGDKTIWVYFTDGSSNGTAITEYEYSLNGDEFNCVGQKKSPLSITEIYNAVNYSVRIKAINKAGASNPSNVSDSVIPYGVPRPPVIRTIIAGDKCVVVHFNTIDDNGSPVTALKYSWSAGPANSGGPVDVSNGIMTSPFTIYGLANQKTYLINMYAINSAGMSSGSNVRNIIPGVPSQPTITKLEAADKSFKIYFTPPLNTNGAPINKYSWGAKGDTGNTYAITGLTNPLTVKSMINGVVYTPVLYATNINGISTPSESSGNVIPIGVPVKMVAPTVVAALNRAIISFTAPDSNGATITKYKYQLGTDKTFYDVSGLATTFTVPAPNNVSYTVVMTAENAAGTSQASPASKAVLFAYKPPEIPTKPLITAGFCSVSVSVIPPANNGYPILGYKYSLNGATPFTDASVNNMSASNASFAIAGLLNNVDYSVRVITVNEAGESKTSLASNIVKYVYLPPDKGPSITTAVAGNECAFLTITPPATRTAPITNYYYTVDNGTTLVDMSYTLVTSGTKPIVNATATGLTNDVSYNIKVVAGTPVGNSPVSADAKPFVVVPLYKPPAVGPAITDLSGGNRQIIVSFTAPATRIAPITTYYYSMDGGTTLVDLHTTVSPATITGLINDTSYNVVLVAGTPAGNSPPGIAKSIRISYNPPLKPVITSATSWNQSAIVNFTAPISAGSAIFKYMYATGPSFLITNDISGIGLPLTITGLTNDVSYNMAIFAVNSAGVSPPSDAFTVRPVYGVPSMPVVATITSTATGASITYTPSLPNGSTITTYKYSTDGGANYTDLGKVPTATFPITGLTTKTTYSFILKSTNGSGDSLPSVAKPFTTK